MEIIGRIGRELKAISRISRYAWEKGWAEAGAGNISVDISDSLDELQLPRGTTSVVIELPRSYPSISSRIYLVTIAGARFRDIADDPAGNAVIIQVSDSGEALGLIYRPPSAPNAEPTSELPTHLAVHEFLSEQGRNETVVFHSHPTELIAITQLDRYSNGASLNKALASALPELALLMPEGAGFVEYCDPGSDDLANRTVEELSMRRAVVWAKHGALSVAESAPEAFDIIDLLNKAAKIKLLMLQADGR